VGQPLDRRDVAIPSLSGLFSDLVYATFDRRRRWLVGKGNGRRLGKGGQETDKIHKEGHGAWRGLAWQRTMILGGCWFRPEVFCASFRVLGSTMYLGGRHCRVGQTLRWGMIAKTG